MTKLTRSTSLAAILLVELQSHADVGTGLVYRWDRGMELEFGYHFSYFFQHEESREDDNLFELIDNGVRARFLLRF